MPGAEGCSQKTSSATAADTRITYVNLTDRNPKKGRKRVLYTALASAALLLPLSGCGKDGQDFNSDNSLMEPGSQELAADGDTGIQGTAADGIAGSQGLATGGIAGSQSASFPSRYDKTVGNVEFKMDIITAPKASQFPVAAAAKARMQKVNREKAFQLFFSTIEKYDTYDYEETDEYGKAAHQVTYVSPEETTLAYGPQSSTFNYMERDLMPYVLNAFIPFEDDRYNANLYSTEAQLPFMPREEAFETIQKALREMDIQTEAAYTCYALDHKTMQSQEHHEDMDGNVDKSQYKPQWSEADDCYYFCIHQTYRGLPLYHVYHTAFTDADDTNAPIQAVVSAEGIEYLDIEKVFTVSEETEGASLADMDAIAEAAAEKYNQLLGDASYEMTKAELYYYVDLSSGMGNYDVKPVWIITGNERNGRTGKSVQVIIDAQTAEEILP